MKKRTARNKPDKARIIQPWDSIPTKTPQWMFNPPKEVATQLGVAGIVGDVPCIFWLDVVEPRNGQLWKTHAIIAYAHGWWCVGKQNIEPKYNVYFMPTGCSVFRGSLGECNRRMMLLPPFPEDVPVDPPLDMDEWYGTSEMMRASRRWEEIAAVLFEVKEIEYEKVLHDERGFAKKRKSK